MTKNENYCELNGVIIRPTTELPARVGGTCYHDEEGREFILINYYCCPKKQKESFNHEVRHLRRGDMYDVDYIEY